MSTTVQPEQGAAEGRFPREHELLAGVTADRFLRVDELEASTDRQLEDLPGLRAWVCGHDAEGREMRCLEAGRGPRRALLLGHVHGEEPVGTLVLEYLLPLFAESDISERLGFSLAAIKVCDPAAARLNEGWLAQPYDVEAYVLHSYRSAYSEQPVWSFPIEYKGYRFDAPPPETRAMMAAIDAAPLDLIMSLHNCSFYGGYYYVSDADEELLRELEAVREASGIPAHRGEPELPYLTELGDGIYDAVTVDKEYDYLEEYGDGPVELDAGCDCDEYAMRRWGAHAVLAEVPCFTSDQVADRFPAGMTRGEARLEGIALEEEHVEWLRARFAEAAGLIGPAASPWQRAVAGYLADCDGELPAQRREARTAARFAAGATVAQRFDSLYNRELLALCRLGQFARMAAEAATHRSPGQERLAGLRDETEAHVRERLAAVVTAAGIRPVPIRERVRMQLGALLASMAYVGERRPGSARRAPSAS
jgi:hypothetical protein